MHLNQLNYGIVGLGIMGGSFAKAIRENILTTEDSSGQIYACNRSQASLSMAMSEGVVDGVFTSDEVDKMLCLCDVVFICLYPRATLEFLKEHKNSFKREQLSPTFPELRAFLKKNCLPCSDLIRIL